jgi:REP element-mobilizing transposase RayT
MSHYRRADTAGATYFFTVASYRRRHILCDATVRNALPVRSRTCKDAIPSLLRPGYYFPTICTVCGPCRRVKDCRLG